jgi:hypothetical protein
MRIYRMCLMNSPVLWGRWKRTCPKPIATATAVPFAA